MSGNGKRPRKPKPDKPLGTGKNGRDKKGKFSSGNQFAVGSGSGHANHAMRFKSVLYNCVSEEDFQLQAEKVKLLAERGEEWAVKLLWSYLLGKPAQSIDHTGEVNLTVAEFFRDIRDPALLAG